MTRRELQRYIDDLLAGRRPTPFRADEFEAEQIRAAIDLAAARPGADEPSPEFLQSLHDRLAAQSDDPTATVRRLPQRVGSTRRQVIVGTSAAAAAAVAAVAVDRAVIGPRPSPEVPTAAPTDNTLKPNDGAWQPVAASSDVTDTTMTRFEHDSLIGFVRRVDGQLEAVSGVCTHQGCQLWFDQTGDRLRCPCHTTSFAPDGQLLTHQLPIAPRPLPKLEVREADGVVEVYGPERPPSQPS
jgi:cytochrome b6-f complex iron-sulfur subunit